MDERECDEEALLLPAREGHEPGVALAVEAQAGEQRLAVHHAFVERRPEVHRLPHLDPLLEVGLLVLHADALPERGGVAVRVETEHADRAAVLPTQSLEAFHRGGLARAVGADQAEDLALEDVE